MSDGLLTVAVPAEYGIREGTQDIAACIDGRDAVLAMLRLAYQQARGAWLKGGKSAPWERTYRLVRDGWDDSARAGEIKEAFTMLAVELHAIARTISSLRGFEKLWTWSTAHALAGVLVGICRRAAARRWKAERDTETAAG